MRRLLPAAALALAGCFTPPLPGAVVDCASDADCPAKTECRTEVSHCVPAGAERTPPQIRTLAFTPDVGASGTTFTVDVDVDSLLGRAPTLKVNASDATLTAPADLGAEHFTFTWTTPAGDDEGPATLSFHLVDVLGNAADLERPGMIIDRTGPVVGDVVVVAPADQGVAGIVDTIVVEAASEPGAVPSVFEATDGSFVFPLAPVDKPGVPGTVTASFRTADLPVQVPSLTALYVNVAFVDAAGNRSDLVQSPIINVDLVAPHVDAFALDDGAATEVLSTNAVPVRIAVEDAADTAEMCLQLVVNAGDAPSCADADWIPFHESATIPTAAVVGDNLLALQVRDAAHNVSPETPSVSFTFTPAAPNPPALVQIVVVEASPAPLDPSRAADADNSVTLEGLAHAVTTRNVRILAADGAGAPVGAPLADIVAGFDGAFAATTLPSVASGTYLVLAVDDAGVASPPLVVALPRVALAVDDSGIPSAVAVNLTAVAGAGSVDVAAAEVSLDGEVLAHPNSNRVVVNLPQANGVREGDLVIRVTMPVLGAAPGSSATDATSFVFDYTAPTIDPALITSDATLDEIDGAAGAVSDANAADGITFSIDGADGLETDFGADGSFTAQIPNSMDDARLRARDHWGNERVLVVHIDRQPPSVSIRAVPAAAQPGGPASVLVAVTDQSDLVDAPVVTIDGIDAVVDDTFGGTVTTSDGAVHTFRYQTTLPSGGGSRFVDVAARATDAGGLFADAAGALPVLASAPVSTCDMPGVRTEWNGRPATFGSASAALGGVNDTDLITSVAVSIRDETTGTFFDGAAFASSSEVFVPATTTGAPNGTAQWALITVVPYVDAHAYTLRQHAVDAAGNVESAGAGVSFTFHDVTAPPPSSLAVNVVGESLGPSGTVSASWTPPSTSFSIVQYNVYVSSAAHAGPPFDRVVPVGVGSSAQLSAPRGRDVFAVTTVVDDGGVQYESDLSPPVSTRVRTWLFDESAPLNNFDALAPTPTGAVGVGPVPGDRGVIRRTGEGPWEGFDLGFRPHQLARAGDDVIFIDGATYALDDGGAFTVHTLPAGLAFQDRERLIASAGSTLVAIAAFSPTGGPSVSDVMVRSLDAGLTWTIASAPVASIASVAADIDVAVVAAQTVLVSVDGGASYVAHAAPSLPGALAVAGTSIVICDALSFPQGQGSSGSLYVSDDHGATFVEHAFPMTLGDFAWRAVRGDGAHIAAITNASVFTSDDGGATFTETDFRAPPFNSINVFGLDLAGDDVYVYGTGLFASHDGGATFTTAVATSFIDVEAAKNGTAVGATGVDTYSFGPP